MSVKILDILVPLMAAFYFTMAIFVIIKNISTFADKINNMYYE